jgi:hypothetical protein
MATTRTTATTCTTCKCSTAKCGCLDTMLTTPVPCPSPIACPNPEPCSEVLDAQCIIYTQDPILCNTDIVIDTNTVVSDALNNIVDYFCQNIGGQNTIVSAGTGITVTNVSVGNTTTYTVSLTSVAAKVFFHQEVISDINIVSGAPSPGPDSYFFPIGYSTLTYINTALTSKTFKVFVSYDTDTPVTTTNTADFENWVDGAIIKTISAIDTILWQSLGVQDIAGALMDGSTGADVVNFSTTEKVVTTPSINPVEFRFYNTRLPKNVSFYQIVTLAPNETVSLKFKSKSGGQGRLLQAQFMVEEV